MSGLIILSHGSRHPGAVSGVRRLARATSQALGAPVHPAHLDLCEPELKDVVSQLAAEGHERVNVVPLLFTRAFHARYDVPQAVAAAEEAAGITVELRPGLGLGEDLAQLLTQRLALDAPAGAHVVLYPVGSSDEQANAAVDQLAGRVAELSGHELSVIPATGAGRNEGGIGAGGVRGGGARGGVGGGGLVSVAATHPRVHLLPLFVSDGILLDKVTEQLDRIEQVTGAQLSASAPLGTDLAPLVAARFGQIPAA